MVPVTTSLSPQQILPHSITESYTSLEEANLPQYSSPRLSTSTRESRFAVRLLFFCPLICHGQQYVALKISIADGDSEHERNIFARLEEEGSIPNVVKLRNTLSLEGPNGVHAVLMYNMLGNPLSFIHQAGGFKHIKPLCRQSTCGLTAFHHLIVRTTAKYMMQAWLIRL